MQLQEQDDKKEGVVMAEDDASKNEISIRQEGEAEASAAADPQDRLETIVQSWRNSLDHTNSHWNWWPIFVLVQWKRTK
jgi:hypothetical protein